MTELLHDTTTETAQTDTPLLAITYECGPLAYGLHKFGPGKCSRRGGGRVCGACLMDVYGAIMGFRR